MTDQVLKGDASLADEIAHILRVRIINGEYALGEKLVESKIAEELKVSRTPVREAFKALIREDLVEYIPNKGCFARSFEREDVSDVYAVRSVVEQLSIERAIRNKTEEDMAALRDQMEVMERYLAEENKDKLVTAIEAFNNLLCQMTRSRTLIHVLRIPNDYLQIVRPSVLESKDNMKKIVSEYRDLYEAVDRGDVAAAKAAVDTHMRNAAQRTAARWSR